MTIYERAKTIGEKGLAKYLRGDWNETKEDLIKFSYPVLGQLSEKVQDRLESVVGKKTYNQRIARILSLFPNIIIYGQVATYIGDVFGFDRNTSGQVGALIGCLEALSRVTYKMPTIQLPSAAGKIVSLPLEAMLGVYDGMKEREKVK